MISREPTILLVDNGSLRPDSTLALRAIALDLSHRLDQPVEAVSLLHSHKVDATDLNGKPATIVRRRLRELSDLGQRRFCIIPLFLGPSLAIHDYLPKLISEARERCPELAVAVASTLAGRAVEEPDPRLAEILDEATQDLILRYQLHDFQVALVDHGTPAPAVNCVRNAVAKQLSTRLDHPVIACSMERRPGAAYAFNEPLLESIAGHVSSQQRPLILAMLFLLPGRHAGAGGDVSQICEKMNRQQAYYKTDLIGTHPKLIDILQDRFMALQDC